MNSSGIYKITNIANEKFYIGSAKDLYKRYHNHFSKLGRNSHPNKHLQSSYNKYGKENFRFEILATCAVEYLIKLEQWFIDTLKPTYNKNPIAGSSLGTKHSEEIRRKISENRKGIFVNEEWRKNIGIGHMGLKRSEEAKLKMSIASKGKPKSEEARRNMSIAKKGKTSPRKGVKLSEEVKKRMSESRINYFKRRNEIK